MTCLIAECSEIADYSSSLAGDVFQYVVLKNSKNLPPSVSMDGYLLYEAYKIEIYTGTSYNLLHFYILDK